MRALLSSFLCSLLAMSTAFCQNTPASSAPARTAGEANPLSQYNRQVYAGVKDILLRTAQKVPEDYYSFRPTDAVRSFGQILGHVADSQYYFCSVALGDNNPSPKIEKTKTTKVDLTAALKESFAYCDKAYDTMTDASGTQIVKLMGGDAPKLGVLSVNNIHTVEHYGNLVTYMRIKNIVPPTSEPKAEAKPNR